MAMVEVEAALSQAGLAGPEVVESRMSTLSKSFVVAIDNLGRSVVEEAEALTT